MHSFKLSIVFTAVLLGLTAALPHRRSLGIPIQKRSTLAKDGIVKLDAARAHLAYSERKYLQGLSALQGSASQSSSSAHTVTRRDGGTDPLTDDGNSRWYGTISVGTPSVEYKMDFDTGSADLFLPGSNCNSTCNGHTLYNPSASSTAVDLHRIFIFTYGDGSKVHGEQYTDTVTISGFVADNQTLGAASQYSTGFQISGFAPDGLMGMAFTNIAVSQRNPVVQTLIAAGQLPEPVFAFKLTPSGSELRIGGIDTSVYTGSITYAPVTLQGFWQIQLDSINANGNATNQNVSAVVDTGTTYILGDAETVGQFYSGLNATEVGGGFYTLPCNGMPNVSITIQGRTFPIAPELFNLGSYGSSTNSCFGAIVGSSELGDTFIVGDTFLRNVYSIFDVGGLRVGFATLT